MQFIRISETDLQLKDEKIYNIYKAHEGRKGGWNCTTKMGK